MKVGDLISQRWIDPSEISSQRYYVGDLIFSNSGYSGVVLVAWHSDKSVISDDGYIVLWTLTNDRGTWYMKEQYRRSDSLRRKK